MLTHTNMAALITMYHDNGRIKSTSSGYFKIKTKENVESNSIVVAVHKDFLHNNDEASKAKVKFFLILDDHLHEVELSGKALLFDGRPEIKTADLICETADAQQIYLFDRLEKDMYRLMDYFSAIPSTVKEIISQKAFIFTRKMDGSLIFSSGNGWKCFFRVTNENGITFVSAQEENLDSPLDDSRKCLKHKCSTCPKSVGSLIVYFEKSPTDYFYEYWMQYGVFVGTDCDVSNLKAVSRQEANEGFYDESCYMARRIPEAILGMPSSAGLTLDSDQGGNQKG